MVFLARKGKMVDVPAPAKEKTRKEKEEDDDDDDDDVSSREAEADSAQPAEQAPSTGQSSRSHHSEYKFGIAERLTRAVKEKALENEAKRSPDLVPLSKQFDAMRKRLRAMIQTAKQYKKSMEKVDDDRMQMIEEMCTYAEGSPIEAQIKNLDIPSFLSAYTDASAQSGRYMNEYQSEIIDYIVEWENVVSSRVDKEMKDVNELRKTYNHYQVKVDGLRKKVNSAQAKGKSVNDATAEKLKRNEDKLDEASDEFEEAAAPLCYLFEEVVHNAYKDLYPLVLTMMEWESERSYTESTVFGKFRSDLLEAAFHGTTVAPSSDGAARPQSPTRPKSPTRRDYAPQTPTRSSAAAGRNQNAAVAASPRKPYEIDDSEYSESSYGSAPLSPVQAGRRVDQV